MLRAFVDFSLIGLRLGRPRTLVLTLTRAKSVLGFVLSRTGRATGVLDRAMGARWATSVHALRYGSRARHVGHHYADVCHRARGRSYARTTHRRRACDHQCYGGLSGAARAGGPTWFGERVRG